MGTVLLVALGFVFGVLFLALIAWIAFNFFGFRIVQTNIGTPVPASPPVRPSMPPVTLSKAVPAAAPPTPAQARTPSIRVELIIENKLGKDPKEISVPLVFCENAPEEGLKQARRTIVAGDLSPEGVGIGLPTGLPSFSRELVESLQPGGCLLIGRGGHVGVEIPGFEVMSRVLCEITVVKGRFHLSAKKGMSDYPVQVTMGKREPVIMNVATAPIAITEGVEIRQVMVRPAGGPLQVSKWRFKIILC